MHYNATTAGHVFLTVRKLASRSLVCIIVKVQGFSRVEEPAFSSPTGDGSVFIPAPPPPSPLLPPLLLLPWPPPWPPLGLTFPWPPRPKTVTELLPCPWPLFGVQTTDQPFSAPPEAKISSVFDLVCVCSNSRSLVLFFLYL